MNCEGNESSRRLQLAICVADKYQNIGGIDSIAVGGSTAIQSAYSGSDLDMWATHDEPPDPGDTEQAIRELIEEYGDESQPTYMMTGHVNNFRLDGIDVVIMFGHNDDLQKVPDQLHKDMGTPNEQAVAEYHHMVVLYDPKDVWRRIKERLDDYPIDIGAKIAQTKLEELVRAVSGRISKAIITRNALYALELNVTSLDEYLRLLFALNKCYYKRLIDVAALLPKLGIKPKACEERLAEWIGASSLPKVQRMIMELLKDTIPFIERIYPSVDLSWSLRRLEGVSLES